MENVMKELDAFWGRLFSFNQLLRKQSEDKKQFGKESFTDIMDFYLSSQALGFLKDMLLEHLGSPGMLLTARCFLEGLAIKRMYQSGKITELQVELLRKQVHLIEYKQYSKFKDIAVEILIPEKLEEDYNNAADFFREKLSDRFDQKQIARIIKSEIPFLCNPDAHYLDLIKEFLGEHYAKHYGLYSQAIHPSANDLYCNGTIWETIPDVLYLILKEYVNLPSSQIIFQNFFLTVTTSDPSIQYQKLVNQECILLGKVADTFRRFFGKNYVSDTFTTARLLLLEVCNDKLLGLCEQVKAKWKILLELFASFYNCYNRSFPSSARYEMLKEHEKAQIQNNLQEEVPLESAYELYKTIYPNGINSQIFRKGFLKTSGYTIDEKGSSKRLSDLVADYLNVFAAPDAKISRDRGMLLDYVESQMISHANGYMWYANSGSWGDYYNIIIGTDCCIVYALKTILTLFSAHKTVEKTNTYKPIVNVVRNAIKKMDPLIQSKAQLLLVPGVAI